MQRFLWGDQENYGLFQQFGTFLVWNAPLRVSVEGGVGVVKNNFVLDSKWSKLSWGGVVKTIIDFFNKLGHFLLCNVPLEFCQI